MPKNWITYKLGEMMAIGSSKRIFRADYVSNGIPFYRSKEIIQKARNESIDDPLFIGKRKFEAIQAKYGSPQELDILISSVGNRSGIPYLVQNEPDFYFKDGNLIWFKNFEKEIHSPFLYRWLTSNIGQSRLRSTMIGSAQRALTIEGIKSIDTTFPPLPEQRAIASILSAIDDKIENNLAMNKTLEDMAIALYKHWFVDFGPFQEGKFIDSELGKIPEGWEVKSFKDLVEHSVGGDWGKETLDDNHTVKSTVIRGTDFLGAETGSFKEIPIRYVKESKFKSRKLIDGDIIIEISGGTSDRPTGRTLLVNDNLIQNLGKNVIPTSFCRLIRPVSRMHFFPLGLHIKYIYSKGKTWIYQNQSTGLSNFQYSYFAKEERIPVPKDLTIYKNFDSFITPLYKLKNTNEIKALTQLRDTLLPKLISGEVRLKEFEEKLTAAL